MNRLNYQTALPRIELKVHFRNGHCGQGILKHAKDKKLQADNRENLPRLTRLLALAHRWNHLIEEGVVTNHAEIARLMGLSRARVTQITSLLYLAPLIQEDILLPIKPAFDVPEKVIREIYKTSYWAKQEKLWRKLLKE